MKIYSVLTILSCFLVLSTSPTLAQATPPELPSPPANNPQLNRQQQQISRDLEAAIELLRQESTYTESIKDYLPPNDTKIIMEDLQSTRSKLQEILASITDAPIPELRAELESLQVQAHTIRRNRLHRTIALLTSYQSSLAKYTLMYEQISIQNSQHSLFSTLLPDFNQCIQQSKTPRAQANALITDTRSQLGSLNSLSATQAAELDRSLRKQLSESKNALDQSREQLRSCSAILQP